MRMSLPGMGILGGTVQRVSGAVAAIVVPQKGDTVVYDVLNINGLCESKVSGVRAAVKVQALVRG